MPAPPQGPFATPAFKPFINRWVGFCLFYCFVAVFRLSDVVYLASMRHIVGDTQLLQEDVQMISYASFIGMTMIFPILFRLKFRFTTQGILTFVTLSLCLFNIAFTRITSVPLLVVIGFLSGALRICGMFECMSSIMQGITPQRDFAVFFPWIYCTVLGFIQVTGFIDAYLVYWFNWQMMNYVDIALLLTVCVLVRVLMRPFHLGPPMPLYGIDWLGAILWAIALGAGAFLFTYGEYFEWSGAYMRGGLGVCLLALGIVLGRTKHIRHPYLEFKTFTYPNVWNMLLLFLIMCFLVESQMVLQNAFTGGILHFDTLNSVRLNLPQLAGILTGGVFSCVALTRLGWSYKQLTFTGFLFITYYLAAMYFLIDSATNIEALYLPVFLLGMGNVTVYVAVTVYTQKIIPFQHFFQGLCILGFVRTGIGNPLSVAILDRAMKYCLTQHTDLMGSQLNPTMNVGQMINTLGEQATLATLKQLFGLCVLIGIGTLLLILGSRFKPALHYLVPTDWQLYRRMLKWNTKLRKAPHPVKA